MLAFFRNDMGFGGNNGFTDFKDIARLQPARARHAHGTVPDARRWRSAAAICCAASIIASRAGRVIQAVRDAESRARFIGYRVESYKLWVFVFSAVLAGDRRRALRAADRHHQPGRILAGELDRDRHLGGDRRPRHALRCGGRCVAGELCQDLFHRGPAEHVAVRARGVVRAGDTVPAARRGRAADCTPPPRGRAPTAGRHDPRRARPILRPLAQSPAAARRGRCSTATGSAPGPMPRAASCCIWRTSRSASTASRRSMR